MFPTAGLSSPHRRRICGYLSRCEQTGDAAAGVPGGDQPLRQYLRLRPGVVPEPTGKLTGFIHARVRPCRVKNSEDGRE